MPCNHKRLHHLRSKRIRCYITVTESGLGLIERQEAVLKDYYRRVIEKFGAENMIAFLNQMKSLEEIMDAELKEEDNG